MPSVSSVPPCCDRALPRGNSKAVAQPMTSLQVSHRVRPRSIRFGRRCDAFLPGFRPRCGESANLCNTNDIESCGNWLLVLRSVTRRCVSCEIANARQNGCRQTCSRVRRLFASRKRYELLGGSSSP